VTVPVTITPQQLASAFHEVLVVPGAGVLEDQR
jgi:hypothetical protein